MNYVTVGHHFSLVFNNINLIPFAKKILKYFEVPMEFDFTGTVKLNTNNQCRIFFYNFAYFCKPIYSKKLTFKLNYSIFCILCVRMNPYNNRRKK